jgi:hypothetical protein
MPKDVMYGKTLRKSFARSREIQEMPNLLEIQKESYKWFLEEGLREVFTDVDSVTDYSGNLELSFVDYSMNEKPKYTEEECKARDATYAAPLKVGVRLRNRETLHHGPQPARVVGMGVTEDEQVDAGDTRAREQARRCAVVAGVDHHGMIVGPQQGRVALLDGSYDTSVVDLPYGILSKDSRHRYFDIMSNIRRICSRSVILSAEDISDTIYSSGFKIVESCIVHKGGLDRYIWVCR